MLLTDYLRCDKDGTWDVARQCGVRHAVIRLPEDGKFDYADPAHWETVCKKYRDFGFTPVIVEPMPNELHDHIKAGDEQRDECLEKALTMLPCMAAQGITTICFNFMAHVGWLRTGQIEERGGALVTEFSQNDFRPGSAFITEEQLWKNYEVFVSAMAPEAEKYGIRLALHPDDPPLKKLGNVSRIMVSKENIERAVRGIVQSPCLGVTFCQANYFLMGEDVESLIRAWRDKIFFVHFRNVRGEKTHFNETFHDNGALPMARLMRVYREEGVDVPIRVDHVPTLVGEDSAHAGYDALGRLFAIGYLKGLLEATED